MSIESIPSLKSEFYNENRGNSKIYDLKAN